MIRYLLSNVLKSDVDLIERVSTYTYIFTLYMEAYFLRSRSMVYHWERSDPSW